MKNIEDIKKKIDYAYTIQNSSTTLMRQLMDEFREQKTRINYDRSLSDVGKRERIVKLQAEWERKALDLARDIKSNYQKAVTDVKEASTKIMHADIPEVDSSTHQSFRVKVDELQSQVLFATSATAAKKALKELVKEASHPSLASEVKGQFLQLSQQAFDIAANQMEALSMRKELGDLYQQLSKNGLTEEGRAASNIVDQADAMVNAQLFSPLVRSALQEISPLCKHYVNDPDAYFSKNGGEK